MQNASAPPADLPSVVIVEVPPEQQNENNDNVPQENNDNEVPPSENNETPQTDEIFSSYEDQGRVPPPFPADNHHMENVWTE